QRLHVELGHEAKVYDQMATQMVAEIRQYTAEAKIPLVKFLRLAQISGGFVTTDKGKVVRVGTSKIDAVRPHVEQCMENEERIAITARFKPELDALYSMAQKFKVPVFEIRGGMPKGQMRIDKQQAIRHKGPLIYILQPRAASLGIDLSFLSRMMWYSLTNSFVDYSQCCDRIALSRKSTTFTYFLCEGIDTFLYDEMLTGDGQFLQALRQKPERILRK
ncbi:MAG: helicase-related protein, partial [Gloeomargaritales cyanobacterium]